MVTADQRVLAQTSVEDQPASVDGDARYDLCAASGSGCSGPAQPPARFDHDSSPASTGRAWGRSPAWSTC